MFGDSMARSNDTKGRTALLFHGSPIRARRLEPRDLHGDPQIPPAVFASPSREFALAYSGSKWGDRDLEQSVHYNANDQDSVPKMVLQEMRPGALKEIFDRSGYLYSLPAETFEAGRQQTPWEMISKKPVMPTRTERVKNILEALGARSNVTLLPYNKRRARATILSNRRYGRLLEMDPAARKEYLSWYSTNRPPELESAIAELREKLRQGASGAKKTATDAGNIVQSQSPCLTTKNPISSCVGGQEMNTNDCAYELGVKLAELDANPTPELEKQARGLFLKLRKALGSKLTPFEEWQLRKGVTSAAQQGRNARTSRIVSRGTHPRAVGATAV